MAFTPTPFASPVVNPIVSSLLNRVPYLTVSQFMAAVSSLDVSSIVPGGSAQSNEAVLAEFIAEASAWIDTYCFTLETGGVLAATEETDTGTGFTKTDGYIWLACRFKPVLALTGLAIGPRPSLQVDIDPTVISDIAFRGKTFKVPGWGLSSPATLRPTFVSGGLGARLFATWTYITGYPHAQLSENIEQGATSIETTPILGVGYGTVSPLGVVTAGATQLLIYDGVTEEANNEMVTAISATTTGGVSTLTLAAPTKYAHTVPAAPDAIIVSALPPTVIRAAVYCTAAFIKRRGGSAMVLKDLSAPEMESEKDGYGSSETDLAYAAQMLDQFRIVTAGS